MSNLAAEHERLLARLSRVRVLVVGDAMLDEYLHGVVRRISPEAPVPVVELHERTFVPGGAANTAANVAGLAAQAVLAAVVGDDEPGWRRAMSAWTACSPSTTGRRRRRASSRRASRWSASTRSTKAHLPPRCRRGCCASWKGK
jgi:bifunctional ADP-heptose synthase (sugar kinase/adenylyltransferase)